ncbi:MAG: sugar ABC transporter permease [Candidatus Phytoplasma sp.]|nr:sugar ABC transporter permease [Phytoplasma sp.]
MLERKKDYHAWLYMIIPLALLGLFTFYPLFKTILISFDNGYNKWQDAFSFNLTFESYRKVLSHNQFQTTLKNTLILVFVSVPVSTMLALFIAVGLNSIKPLQKVFQTIFFMPYVTNTIAIGMVFAVMFNVQNGLINEMLSWIGLSPRNWVNNTWNGMTASYGSRMFVLQFYTIWNGLAFKILVFIGGLQNISKQYYDAAKIDSTSKGRVFRKITVPLLSPIISYILITSFIGAFKTYDSVVGVFGSNWETTWQIQTVVGYVYHQLAETTRDSYSLGAAAAVILFAIIMVFTGINYYLGKKRVHY